jgi:arabinan endo-1,5-alpha-L-arabinosidase
MVKLHADMTSVAQPEEWFTLARRQRDFLVGDSSPGNAAIEAPFIFRKDKYYYLFVSWDYCCRGEMSDYKVVVGRSEKARGPYIDKTGKSMFMGGGSLVVEGDNKLWNGAGHNAAYTFDGKDYIIYHGYDAQDKGRSKLIIRNLKWNDGWPEVENS